MGTASFAVPALEAVHDHVVLVVSQPDKPSGRGLSLVSSPVKQRAIELGLSVETPARSRNPEFVESVRALNADVLLVAAYGQILSKELLSSAKQGGVNLHGSLLPKYRGAAPIQRSVQNGDTETGVTLMQMDVGMDTGNIIAIERVPIGRDQTASELFDVLGGLAGRMASEWMPKICAGNYVSVPQDEALATHAPKVEKKEAQLRFENKAQDEYNRFRAFTRFPGAFVKTIHGSMKVLEARMGSVEGRSGVVLQTQPSLTVGFGSGSIDLIEVQPEGKKRMAGAAWANGARIKVGDCLSP